jgi:hypothetical protein
MLSQVKMTLGDEFGEEVGSVFSDLYHRHRFDRGVERIEGDFTRNDIELTLGECCCNFRRIIFAGVLDGLQEHVGGIIGQGRQRIGQFGGAIGVLVFIAVFLDEVRYDGALLVG